VNPPSLMLVTKEATSKAPMMYTQNTLLLGSARNEMGSKKSSKEKMSNSQAVLYF